MISTFVTALSTGGPVSELKKTRYEHFWAGLRVNC